MNVLWEGDDFKHVKTKRWPRVGTEQSQRWFPGLWLAGQLWPGARLLEEASLSDKAVLASPVRKCQALKWEQRDLGTKIKLDQMVKTRLTP